ncbi:MAG TPA: response regulator [Pirellulales bacterium]|jgi:FixJ family two-component response regulator|nr:response regulator [Pirellulales bacterium]
MTTEPIVFVVDDDPAARDSVAALVKSKGVQVRVFASGEEFLASLDPGLFGCVVADVRMTGISGLELQSALNQRNVSLPVIIITGFGDIPTAVRAMKAGASTFLAKPCRAEELWASIQKALRDAAEIHEAEDRAGRARARLATLTPEERQVMRLMLVGKTNKMIATELDFGLRTIELRRANIMRKMEADTFADLVRLILVAGDQEWPADATPESTSPS